MTAKKIAITPAVLHLFNNTITWRNKTGFDKGPCVTDGRRKIIKARNNYRSLYPIDRGPKLTSEALGFRWSAPPKILHALTETTLSFL